MWNVIRELAAGGVALLLTTQHLDEADELADQHVVHEGQPGRGPGMRKGHANRRPQVRAPVRQSSFGRRPCVAASAGQAGQH
jgi:hypothetical protein